MAVPALFPAVQLRPPLLTQPASSHPEEQSTAQHCLTAGNLCSSIKIKKKIFFLKNNQGTFLFFGGRRRIENVEEKNAGVGWDGREDSKHNPAAHPKGLPFCTAGSCPHSKAHGPLGLPRLRGPVRSSSASACPRSRSFSLKWQQWAYPVQGQCWSLWDAGCYSKTCTLD